MLEIGIHDDGGSTLHVTQSCCDRDLLAEVATEGNRLDARIRAVETFQFGECAVRRSVIDEDDLPRPVPFDDRLNTGQKGLQALSFVEDRDNDGYQRGAHGTGSTVLVLRLWSGASLPDHIRQARAAAS